MNTLEQTPADVDGRSPIVRAAALRHDAEATRSRLIAAALDLVNDQGIEAGTGGIAQRTGVGALNAAA